MVSSAAACRRRLSCLLVELFWQVRLGWSTVSGWKWITLQLVSQRHWSIPEQYHSGALCHVIHIFLLWGSVSLGSLLLGATLLVASGGLLPVGSARSHHSWYTHGDTSHNGSSSPIACLVITNPCGRKIGFRSCQVAWKAAGGGQSNSYAVSCYPPETALWFARLMMACGFGLTCTLTS